MSSPSRKRSYTEISAAYESISQSAPNIRRKLPVDRDSRSPSPSSSSVVSSSSSSASDSSASPSLSPSPQQTPASLHARLRSFLPQLAAANATLAEAEGPGIGFELEAVPIDESVTEKNRVKGGQGAKKKLAKGVDEKEDKVDVSDEDEAEEDGPYIEMVRHSTMRKLTRRYADRTNRT